jgi:hypothetical protein
VISFLQTSARTAVLLLAAALAAGGQTIPSPGPGTATNHVSAVSIDSHTYYASAHGTALSSCANAVTTCQVSTSFVIPHTGDAVTLSVFLCWNAGCNQTIVGSSTLSASDGTNSYTWDTTASSPGTYNANQLYNFEACNATAGTYTLTLSSSSGSNHFYYVNVEAVTWLGAHASCVDTNISHFTFGTSAAPSITSTGNVTQAGEGVLAWMLTANSPTNSGSCTTLESGALLNDVVVVDTLNPTSGTTVTCAVSQTSAAWDATIIGIK